MSDELLLRVVTTAVTPGEPTPVTVHLANQTTGPLSVTLSLTGLEAGWFALPPSPAVLEAGEERDVDIVVTLPAGYPSASIPVAIVASTEHSVARSTFTLAVGDAHTLAIRLDPSEVDGTHRGRFTVAVRNRGRELERYRLRGASPIDGVDVRLDEVAVVVQPGEERVVTGTITTARRLGGPRLRHPFTVTAQGRGRPVEVTGGFTSRPELGTRTTKTAVLLAALAVWIAIASIGINALQSALHRRTEATQSVANPTTASSRPPTSTRSRQGSKSSSSPPSAQLASTTTTATLVGTITGPAPGGVTVTATPQSAAPSSDPSSFTAPGAFYGTAYVTPAAFDTPATLTTTSAPDGAYVLAGLVPGVRYLLTFTKAGFQTRSFELGPVKVGERTTLAVHLLPGTGTLSGAAMTATGPLGGATVTVSNGSVTYTTHTVSTGASPGTWTINHVATPGTYLVTTTAPGYGTQVATVTLPPSGSRSGIDLALAPDVGTITGSVTSAVTSEPLGGVTVTATNGTTTVTASTLTVGVIGSFVLPNLSIPHHWTLSFSAPGYETETETVDLTGNTTVNLLLPQAGANLVGTITVPSDTPASATTTIGLTLSNGSTTYKTLSTSRAPGSTSVSYQFPQVPPGTYVLAAEGFGFLPSSASVTLSAGATATNDLTLQLAPPSTSSNGSITGTVVATSGSVLADVPVTLSMNGTTATTTTNVKGAYTFTNVGPGVATLTADGTSITQGNQNGFTTTSEQVLVATGAAVDAPTIVLSPLGSISVTLLSSTGQAIPSTLPGCASSVSLSATLSKAGVSVPITPTQSGALFTFSGVAPGTYVITGSATCYIPATSSVTIASGQIVSTTLELSTVPTYAITVDQLQASGSGSFTATAVAGACVTLTNGSNATTSVTNSAGVASFGDLTQGTTYAVSVSEYSQAAKTQQDCTGTPIATAQQSFTAEANGTDQTVLLSPKFADFSVSLAYPFVDAATTQNGSILDCPLLQQTAPTGCPPLSSLTSSDVEVSLTGLTSSQSSFLPSQTQSQTFSPTSSSGGVWTFSSTELSSLVSTTATLNVAVQGFATLTRTVTLPTGTSSSVNELLTPSPVPVTVDAPPNLSAVTVTPSALVPESTNTLTTSTTIGINVTTGSGGSSAYLWADPATGYPSGYAEPGIYNIGATGSGLEVPSTQVTIPPCTSSGCSQQTISLKDNALTIEPQDLPSSATATATLYCVETQSLVQVGTPIALASGSVTFWGLGPSTLIAGSSQTTCSTFTYTLTLDGTTTYVSTNELAVTTEEPSTTTRTPYLTYIYGELEGQAYASGPTTALGGTNVSVCTVDQTSCPSTDTLSATTQTDGAFFIPSVATPTVSGGSLSVVNSLAVGTYYPVTISSTAYSLASGATVSPLSCSAPSGSVCAPSSITPQLLVATANPVTQTIVVTTGSTSASVTVTPETTSNAPTVASQTHATSCTTTSGTTSCSYSFTFSLQPAQWTFQATATNFTTGFAGPVTYEAGASPAPLSITISQPTTTVSGTVYVADSATDSSSTPIGCLTLALMSGSTTIQTTTTAPTAGETCTGSTTTSPGSYSFTGVAAGTYSIAITSSGYAEQQPVSFATNIPNPTLDNFTVYANDVPLTVTLSSPSGVSASDLQGATVTLTPTTARLPASCSSGDSLLGLPQTASQSATADPVTSGSSTTYEASFASLPPDAYQISITGSQVPTQPSPLPTVVVCPGESSASTSVTVDQGAVTGTITVTLTTAATSSTTETVTITAAAPSSTTTTPSSVTQSCTVTIESGGSSGTCTYTLEWLAFGTTYTISTSPSASNPSTSPTFDPSSATPTATANFTITIS